MKHRYDTSVLSSGLSIEISVAIAFPGDGEISRESRRIGKKRRGRYVLGIRVALVLGTNRWRGLISLPSLRSAKRRPIHGWRRGMEPILGIEKSIFLPVDELSFESAVEFCSSSFSTSSSSSSRKNRFPSLPSPLGPNFIRVMASQRPM